MLNEEDFRKARGYKLLYDIYLPSTWTGWVHEDHCLFHYNPATSSYVLENIIIGQHEVDNLGSRFKISSRDWRYQFGIGHHAISLNESTLGLDNDGTIVRLALSRSGRSDMRIEFSQEDYSSMQGKVLSFELKVLDDSSKPEAILLLKIKDPASETLYNPRK